MDETQTEKDRQETDMGSKKQAQTETDTRRETESRRASLRCI